MEKLFDFEAVLSQLPEILKYLPTTLGSLQSVP